MPYPPDLPVADIEVRKRSGLIQTWTLPRAQSTHIRSAIT